MKIKAHTHQGSKIVTYKSSLPLTSLPNQIKQTKKAQNSVGKPTILKRKFCNTFLNPDI